MKRIFLIGYMGAGKTTVGKVLSQQLGLSFIDLDHYIEGRYHKTVGQLFAERGEEAFRDIERRMLREVAAFEDVLVSTGGGAPCFFDNIEFMNEAGQTVYLKVSVEELAKRLELCKSTRPILKGRSGDELKSFIAESLEKREPFYSKAAIVFEAEEMMTDQDVHKISQELATRL
ncbi:shikimate kinase [Parabacteroides johnsonii]|jgi:shikimate kinase|uniref:Shikimate kinase n=1 Tax=Parabacteroides johnsonii CL02T12C29 TaxID=999419 RepID=K5ZIA4_9BACT|nr:shikimate kinase [Parabacteroides johnsonii]EKN11196.1 shikimate kinase [Parabacteroides johnsonii CL02T12C29]